MKIPKSFNLFSSTIKVVFDNTICNLVNAYGRATYSESKIQLSDVDGNVKLSEDRIIDAFYHEKVHIILDSMHEHDLSSNEKFVDVFSKLLRQSDETAKY